MHFIQALKLTLASCSLVLGVQMQQQAPASPTTSKTMVEVHDGPTSTCSPLKSQGGMYYSIRVSVGTPEPQALNVVADTGSNTLIIQDCQCRWEGACTKDSGNSCFRRNESKTLKLMMGTLPDPNQLEEEIPFMAPMSGATFEELIRKPQPTLSAAKHESKEHSKVKQLTQERVEHLELGDEEEARVQQRVQERMEERRQKRIEQRRQLRQRLRQGQGSGDIPKHLKNITQAKKELPLHLTLNFGSGSIEGLLATDRVRIGKVGVDMRGGFMLMTDAQLDFGATIDGILGLGPNSSLRAEEEARLLEQYKKEQRAAQREAEKQGADAGNGGQAADQYYYDGISIDDLKDLIPAGWDIFGDDNGPELEPTYVEADFEPTGFFEQDVTMHSFSLCFNAESDGTFRAAPPRAELPHKSMGVYHWGVGFNGISVGDKSLPVLFCHKENMTEGQDTPCGAIPDSGTTLLIGPEEQVNDLLGGLCKGWDRCNKNYTRLQDAVKNAHAHFENWGFDPYQIADFPASDVFNLIMGDCESWLGDDDDIDKHLPSLFFHVEGVGKTKQSLEMPPHSYIFVETIEEMEYEIVDIPGYGPMPMGDGKPTGKFKKQCTVGFSSMEYTTQNNGPIWIMGTALFYKYEVGYNMKENTVSFTPLDELTCGACNTDTGKSLRHKWGSLIAGGKVSEYKNKQRMRKLERSMVRQPKYDTRLPL